MVILTHLKEKDDG